MSVTLQEAVEFYRADRVARLYAEFADAVQLAARSTRRCPPAICWIRRTTTLEVDLRQVQGCRDAVEILGRHWPGVSPRAVGGSLIRATNGHSNGIVPWLKTLDTSVAAVNQGGKRKGACCVYLEPWHADIEEFLELRENTGDWRARTYNLNLANWIPDLFMQRVEADEMWSLFDPKVVPHLPDLYGEEFDAAYERGGSGEELYAEQIKARDLYARMMRTLWRRQAMAG